jgi:uncharacterized protein YidB (DUF937 family)
MAGLDLNQIRKGGFEMSGSGRGGGIAGSLPTGVKMAAIALLIHSLMKHSRAEQGGTAVEPEGGGLGGILGRMFGKGDQGSDDRGPAATPGQVMPPGAPVQAGDGGFLSGLLVGPVLGGLGGLLDSLRGHGIGSKVDSWVAQGENKPVSPQEIERSFAPGEIDDAARQVGTDRSTLLNELSEMLPKVVDGLTPSGKLPQHEQDIGSLSDLLGNLMRGAGQNSSSSR